MDWSLFQAINGLAARHDGFEDVLRFFAVDAQILFLALLAGLFLARGKWASANARRGVIAAGLSAGLGLAAAQVIAHAVDRLRPWQAHPGDVHVFAPLSHDPSFPSDHAVAAFAIAVAILLRSRRAGLLALALAAVVSVARIVVGVHYPGDVLGGAALGSLAAIVLWIPPVRGPLHRLADGISGLYERLAVAALRRAPA